MLRLIQLLKRFYNDFKFVIIHDKISLRAYRNLDGRLSVGFTAIVPLPVLQFEWV